MSVMSRIAADWARRCFGDNHVTNFAIRGLRTLEESAELAQAVGVTRELAHKTIDAVFDKPVGDVDQEIGGTLLTTVILCEAQGKDHEELLERELVRVLQKSPEHFAKRNQAKIDIGLDAKAQVPGDCTRQAPHICAVNGPCNGFPRIEWRNDGGYPNERVLANRLWCNARERTRFEIETATPSKLYDQDPGAYETVFNRWAIIEVRKPLAEANNRAEAEADNAHASGYLASDKH